jgi:hypothetical protein
MARRLCVEWREDTCGKIRAAAAIDQLEERVQVDPAVSRERPRKRRREACCPQPSRAPRGPAVRIAAWI